MASTDEIDQLIQSVNSAAGHARTLVTSLLFVALTMSAMIVGTTDEAMLRDSIDAVPMLGLQISVSLAHLFAPIVLLFLHVGALIQLDMMDARHLNLQQKLRNAVHLRTARAQQRARVDGAVDAYSLIAEEEDPNPSLLRRMMAWLSIVWIPPLVLLAVQINFVRFQHDVITAIQAATLVIDGLALISFFARLRKRRNQAHYFSVRNVLIRLAVALFIIVSFNARPPGADEVVRNVRWNESRIYAQFTGKDTTPRQSDDAFPDATCPRVVGDATPANWDVFLRPVLEFCNLLDTYLCPHTGWGCRYLDLSNRTQIAGDVSGDLIDAIVANSREMELTSNPHQECRKLEDDLNLADPTPIYLVESGNLHNSPATAVPPGDTDTASVAVIRNQVKDEKLRHEFHIGMRGLKLRDRKLRFANFKDAVLVGADLINADLSGTNFEEAYLVQVWMEGADLSGAMLDDAFLGRVSLEKATLKGTSLREAHLQYINLISADLTCARPAQPDDPGCTVLSRSDMTGAVLNGADLTGARLKQVALIGAELRGATLQGADLHCSYLADVDLRGASLFQARLNFTTWKDADLSGAWLDAAKDAAPMAERISLDPASRGFLIRIHGRLPAIADAAIVSPTETAPMDASEIARGLRDVACKDTEIGGGMIRWVLAARGAYPQGKRSELVEAIRGAFGEAIREHGKTVFCSGLADLSLTPDQRIALGIGPPSN